LLVQVDGTPGDGQGQAGLGVVIRDEQGRVLLWRTGRAPAQTNNEAEYQAVLLGLRVVAAAYPGARVRCLTDSRLVVDQLRGQCGNHSASLQRLYTEAVRLCRQIGAVEFVHVPRAVNRLADALAWEAWVGPAPLLTWAGTSTEQEVR
jgi:ribonuclease HI